MTQPRWDVMAVDRDAVLMTRSSFCFYPQACFLGFFWSSGYKVKLFLFFFWGGQLGHLTLEDYQIWSVSSALANEFLNLLFQVGTLHPDTILMLRENFFWNLYAFVLVQVCHIVLGLRPGTPEEEGQIIRYPVIFLHSLGFWQICIWFNVNYPCVGVG